MIVGHTHDEGWEHILCIIPKKAKAKLVNQIEFPLHSSFYLTQFLFYL